MAEDFCEVVLVKPSDRKNIFGVLNDYNLPAIEPPLWAALLGAYLRQQGYAVKIIDAEVEGLGLEDLAKKIASNKPLLVVMVVTGTNLSASTWNMTGARSCSLAIKSQFPNQKVAFWGLHPSALPERTLKEEPTDFVCQGEGFSTLSDLLFILRRNNNAVFFPVPGLWYRGENKQAVSNPASSPIVDLDTLPTPAWDLLPMEKYRAHNWHCFNDVKNRQPYGVLYTSLGCPFNCTFCNLKALSGSPGIRYRSPNKVIEDLDVLVKNYHVKNIKILDECFVLNKEHVLAICDLIIQHSYDLNIWAYSRIDTIDQNLLSKLHQAGFTWLAYGIESGSDEILTGVSKGRFNQDRIRQIVKMTKEAGINVCGNFMFGLPEDTLSSMQTTLDMAKELNCEYTNFFVTMAYPGSQLYDQAVANNTPLPSNWSGYSQYSREIIPLPTKYLVSAQVLKFRDKAFNDFHGSENYLKTMQEKFGPETVLHIKNMTSRQLERDLLKKESTDLQSSELSKTAPSTNTDITRQLQLYRAMLRIRLAEEKVVAEYRKDEMKTPTHLCIGQEAIAVGVCAHLLNEDLVFSNHRGHGHYLAKGGDMKAMFAEFFCKEHGCGGGYSGSMHLLDRAHGLPGNSAIVGGNIPVSVGAAFALKYRQSKNISTVFFGDGAADEGVLYESLNFAVLHHLPVLFVCENNHWAVYSPSGNRQITPIFRRFENMLPSFSGDGNDIEEVYSTAGFLIAKIKSGGGPQFIEYHTLRFMDHCGEQYNPCVTNETIEEWKKKCPISRAYKNLSSQGLLDQRKDTELRSQLSVEIEEAFKFGQQDILPEKGHLVDKVFAQ